MVTSYLSEPTLVDTAELSDNKMGLALSVSPSDVIFRERRVDDFIRVFCRRYEKSMPFFYAKMLKSVHEKAARDNWVLGTGFIVAAS